MQWARAAAAFDVHLDWRWSPSDGALPRDMHGVVTTYQQVAACARTFRGLAHNALVIFDELHHAAEDRAWAMSYADSGVGPPRFRLSSVVRVRTLPVPPAGGRRR